MKPAVLCLLAVVPLQAQVGSVTNWWTYAGDAGHSGWEKNESRFVKIEVRKFRHLWDIPLTDAPKKPAVRSFSAPIVLGNLIGSRGFKELAFVQGANDQLWSIDVDLARIYWQKQLSHTSVCATMPAAVPSLSAPIRFRLAARRPLPLTQVLTQTPATLALPAGSQPKPAPPPVLDQRFLVNPVYAISREGMLYQVRQDDAADIKPPAPFLPPNFAADSINIADNVLYASARSCAPKDAGSATANVFAFDLASGHVTSHALTLASEPSLGTNAAFALSRDQLVSLTARDLQVNQAGSLPLHLPSGSMNQTSPLYFTFRGRKLLATAANDGRIYLQDATSLAAKPLYRTEPIPGQLKDVANRGIWKQLSSWETTDGKRFVLASVWGPLAPVWADLQAEGAVHQGAVVAFRVEEDASALRLTPAWVSRDMPSPEPSVIARGVVFALSNGRYKRSYSKQRGWREKPVPGSGAVLYAIDGLTGKMMWSGEERQPGNLAGVTVANSRVFFITTDNVLHAFGKFLETE